MLMNLAELDWDQELLDELDIPRAMLPDVRSSSEVFGYIAGNLFGGQSVPISGIAGDQHASLFGQGCFEPGMTKNTYGTGSFVLMNTGNKPVVSTKGLITTLAWARNDEVTYALEGSIFSTGASVQWLRDGLRIIDSVPEIDSLAVSVPDSGGVYLVPAFTGLGAPYWDMYARGTILGITRGTTRAHIARAALEATAYQTKDVIEAMAADTGLSVPILRVDGGGSANNFLLQFQSDIMNVSIERSQVAETTALGAAYLAGLSTGFWSSVEEISGFWASDATFIPSMDEKQRSSLVGNWHRAVERSKGWVIPEEDAN